MSRSVQMLLATTNPGKVREIKALLTSFNIELLALDDLDDKSAFEETADSFEQNARDKALHFHRISGLPTIADDSGLSVDGMDGKPGIYSSRWMGENTRYIEKMAEINRRLKEIPPRDRHAHFTCSLAFAWNDEIYATITKRVFGLIVPEPRGENGFGYDPIFYVPELQETFGEASLEEKLRLGHRGRATTAFIHLLETNPLLRNGLGLKHR